MQQYIYQEWLIEKVNPLMKEGKFGEAETLLAQHNSLPFISTEMQKALKEMDAILYSSKKLYVLNLR
jgi:hypothetical protein